MPLKADLKKVMVIGSGPIVIGQAAEFDYAGTQACRSLKDEGLEVVLVNSNPATIMTDKHVADRVYIEPLTPDFLEAVIGKERPDGILATLGGQVGLNLAVDLAKKGTLEKYNVALLGTSLESIKKAEDRELFNELLNRLGIPQPKGTTVFTADEAAKAAKWAVKNAPAVKTIFVKSNVFSNGGANDVQEVAYTVAAGVAYLRALLERGLTIDEAASQIMFGFSMGANFFMQIAKLRAVRPIWAQIVKEFGGNEESQKIHIHGRPAKFFKTVYDPYVNMLRTQTEAMSAALGGAGSITVEPFDAVFRSANSESGKRESHCSRAERTVRSSPCARSSRFGHSVAFKYGHTDGGKERRDVFWNSRAAGNYNVEITADGFPPFGINKFIG